MNGSVPTTVDCSGRCKSSAAAALRRQRGLTLIELMVALVLGLLITAAAVAALIVARQGFNSVDSSTQLRENVRFASSLIQRIAVQAGFNNVSYGYFPNDDQPAGVRGFDNAVATVAVGTQTEPTYTGGTGVNGSDVLALSFWGATVNSGIGPPADGSMINCAGIAEPQGVVTPNGANMARSVFHVVVSPTSGEPTLVCSYRDPVTRNWQSVPLVQGVESLQVLYGVQGVTPGAVPPAVDPAADLVPDRYLRAAQLEVAGNLAATLNNWRRVRIIRIGLVVRGPASSAVDRAATAATYVVLGTGFSLPAADVGSTFTATADGRLRQQLVFNVHLRNPQDQREPPPP